MAACASCRQVTKNGDLFAERIEYVSPNGKHRLRSTTIRHVCTKCARSISDNADAVDFPVAAALEVTVKAVAFVEASRGETLPQDEFAALAKSLVRFQSAGFQEPLL